MSIPPARPATISAGKANLASKRHRRCAHDETRQALVEASQQIASDCRRVNKPLTAEEADRLSIPCYFESLSVWDRAINRAKRNGVYDAITGELREAIDARLMITKALGTTRRARVATTSKALSQQDRALFDAMRELKNRQGTSLNQRQIMLYLKSKGLFSGSRWSLRRKLAAIGFP